MMKWKKQFSNFPRETADDLSFSAVDLVSIKIQTAECSSMFLVVLFFAQTKPLKKIKCHRRKVEFSHSQLTRRAEAFRTWIFNASRNKICYYTFHLSQFAKQIMLPRTHQPPFSRWHDENIKKIARKIQIHNAKRYVLLDKTFCAKNVYNICYL